MAECTFCHGVKDYRTSVYLAVNWDKLENIMESASTDLKSLEQESVCQNCDQLICTHDEFKSSILTNEKILKKDAETSKSNILEELLVSVGQLDKSQCNDNATYCRTCYQLTTQKNRIKLDSYQNFLGTMVLTCLPGLNIFLTENCYICSVCHNNLVACYQFVNMCQEAIEKKKSIEDTVDKGDELSNEPFEQEDNVSAVDEPEDAKSDSEESLLVPTKCVEVDNQGRKRRGRPKTRKDLPPTKPPTNNGKPKRGRPKKTDGIVPKKQPERKASQAKRIRLEDEEPPVLQPQVAQVNSKTEKKELHQCQMCPFTCPAKKSVIWTHLREHRTSLPSGVQCWKCGAVMNSMVAIISHFAVHDMGLYLTVEEDEEDDDSDEVLAKKMHRNYKQPKKIINTNVTEFIKAIQCELCLELCENYVDFRRHNKIHIVEDMLKCSICPFSCSIITAMQTHLNVHHNITTLHKVITNTKVYNELISDPTQPKSEKRDVKEEEEDVAPEEVTCQDCHQTFTSISDYAGHDCPKKDQYCCGDCSLTFNTIDQLDTHKCIRTKRENKQDNMVPSKEEELQGKGESEKNKYEKFKADSGGVENLKQEEREQHLMKTEDQITKPNKTDERSWYFVQFGQEARNSKPPDDPKSVPNTPEEPTKTTIKIEKPIGEPDFECCEKCVGGFLHSNDLINHVCDKSIKSKSSEQEPTFNLPIITAIKSEYELETPVQPKNPDPVEENEVSSSTTADVRMAEVDKFEVEEAGKSYVCKECNFVTRDQKELKVHAHSCGQWWKCPFNDFLTDEARDLEIHLCLAHNKLAYACRHCIFLSYDQMGMQAHNVMSHGTIFKKEFPNETEPQPANVQPEKPLKRPIFSSSEPPPLIPFKKKSEVQEIIALETDSEDEFIETPAHKTLATEHIKEIFDIDADDASKLISQGVPVVHAKLRLEGGSSPIVLLDDHGSTTDSNIEDAFSLNDDTTLVTADSHLDAEITEVAIPDSSTADEGFVISDDDDEMPQQNTPKSPTKLLLLNTDENDVLKNYVVSEKIEKSKTPKKQKIPISFKLGGSGVTITVAKKSEKALEAAENLESAEEDDKFVISSDEETDPVSKLANKINSKTTWAIKNRNINGYRVFFDKVLDKIKQTEKPGMTKAALNHIILDNWRSMSEKEKYPFVEEARLRRSLVRQENPELFTNKTKKPQPKKSSKPSPAPKTAIPSVSTDNDEDCVILD